MKIRVLGSAAGGGLPQWNCGCPNCAAARMGRLAHRTVASIIVSGDDDRWILVNAGCDVTRQFSMARQLSVCGSRKSPVAALLLTDANIDHVAGVLEFRQTDAFSIYSTGLVRQILCTSPMFAQFACDRRQWHTFGPGGHARVDVAEAPQLRIWAIAVPGVTPSYSGAQARDGAAVAYRFEHGGARLVYAPIFLALDDGLMHELQQADAVFLDGTCWTDEELIGLGLGTRTSREMGHQPMSGTNGSLQRALEVTARHRFYTHVNNSNPILDPQSSASRLLREAGFAVASDGLEISL